MTHLGIKSAYFIKYMRFHHSFQAQTLREGFKNKPWAGLIPLLPFSVKPTTKKDIQWMRKFWHIGMIVVDCYLYAKVWTTKQSALLAWLAIGGPFLLLDILRTKIRPLNVFIISFFSPLMRKRELCSPSSTTPFLLSSFIVIALFPKPIAIVSMLCLAFGDVAACMIGLRFGKDKIFQKKSLQGSIACFVVCFLIMLAFLIAHQVSSNALVVIALVGGLAATLGELIAVKPLDDNFTIPVVTASILYPMLLLLSNF